MPRLLVYDSDAPDLIVEVWPGSCDLPEGFFQENRKYFFELHEAIDPHAADLYIDDQPLEALRGPSNSVIRWRWSPGFYAGRIEMRLELRGGRKEEITLISDPDLDKLTRHDFECMVREILEDTFALFRLSGFRTGIARGTGGPVPPVSRLEFIRSRIGEIEKVVREIDANPVRILRPQEASLPYHKARGVTARELARSFARGTLVPVPSGTRILSRDVRAFPERISKTLKVGGFDINEHRAIKAALTSWRSWAVATADRLDHAPVEDGEQKRMDHLWARRCRVMARRLDNLLRLPLFDEVTNSAVPIVAASIFRRIPRYRRFFMLNRDMNLGIAQVQGDFLQMPLARTFDIYELWSFLRVLRAAIDRYGLTGVDAGALFGTLRTGIVNVKSQDASVRIGPGISLAFKRAYQEYWYTSNRSGSFTRTMIPDISFLETEDSGPIQRLIVFDAKYRVERQLDDAIVSLHMYRDALVRSIDDERERIVIGAYLITPDNRQPPGSWENAKMRERLFHPEYRTKFKFGALTLRPGTSLAQVGELLDTVLKDAGISPGELNSASSDVDGLN